MWADVQITWESGSICAAACVARSVLREISVHYKTQLLSRRQAVGLRKSRMMVDDSAAVHRRTVRMSGLDPSLKRTEKDRRDAESEITNRVAEAVKSHSQEQAATVMVSIPPIVQGRAPGIPGMRMHRRRVSRHTFRGNRTQSSPPCIRKATSGA